MNLTKREKSLIYFALIVVFIALYYQYYLSPKIAIIERLNSAITQRKNVLNGISTLNIKKLDDSLSKINENLKELNQKIPDNKDVEPFLINLDDVIAVTGVKLKNMNFENNLVQNQEIQNQSSQQKKVTKNYTIIPVNIRLSGNYTEISSFIFEIQRLKRLNNIQTLDIARDNNSNDLTLNMTIYIYSMKDKGAENMSSQIQKGKTDPFKPLISISTSLDKINTNTQQNQSNLQQNLQGVDINKIITDSVNNALGNFLKTPQQPSSPSGGKSGK